MGGIAVVGLGYVGFPLAVEFGKVRETIGFDPAEEKVESYRKCIDPTGELPDDEIRAASKLTVTTDPGLISEADYIIVAVSTPIDEARRPDFGPLVSASRTVGQNMEKGAIAIYESTVYPGATEESASLFWRNTPGSNGNRTLHTLTSNGSHMLVCRAS